EADAQRLPFPDDHFQIACVAFGLRNVTDTERGLAEMVRVTRPGGRVAILEFSRPRGWFFGRMYRAYFRYLLPRVGQLLARNPDRAGQPFYELSENVELAARASLRPRRFGVDAIILFYDIATLPVAMGLPFALRPSQGPVPDQPIRTLADVRRLERDPAPERY